MSVSAWNFEVSSGVSQYLSRRLVSEPVGLRHRLELSRDFIRLLRTKYVTGFGAPGMPLLDPDTLGWLTTQLKRTTFYLEFGCGGTTVLANNLGVRTISVESDVRYAAAVRDALQHPELTTIMTPRMGPTGLWGMPLLFAGKKGSRYISAPFESLSAEFPDLILIDGRYRAACALESASRAFHGQATSTLLFDDYQPRKQYHVVERYLGRPKLIGRAALFKIGTCDVPRQAVSEQCTDPR